MGFTCVNDVTVRDLQKKDGQWTRAKGFDTFCPLGPRIVAGLDPCDLRIVTRVNGEVRQDSSTADLIFDVPDADRVRQRAHDARGRRRDLDRHTVGRRQPRASATSSRSRSRASACCESASIARPRDRAIVIGLGGNIGTSRAIARALRRGRARRSPARRRCSRRAALPDRRRSAPRAAGVPQHRAAAARSTDVQPAELIATVARARAPARSRSRARGALGAAADRSRRPACGARA